MEKRKNKQKKIVLLTSSSGLEEKNRSFFGMTLLHRHMHSTNHRKCCECGERCWVWEGERERVGVLLLLLPLSEDVVNFALDFSVGTSGVFGFAVTPPTTPTFGLPSPSLSLSVYTPKWRRNSMPRKSYRVPSFMSSFRHLSLFCVSVPENCAEMRGGDKSERKVQTIEIEQRQRDKCKSKRGKGGREEGRVKRSETARNKAHRALRCLTCFITQNDIDISEDIRNISARRYGNRWIVSDEVALAHASKVTHKLHR